MIRSSDDESEAAEVGAKSEGGTVLSDDEDDAAAPLESRDIK